MRVQREIGISMLGAVAAASAIGVFAGPAGAAAMTFRDHETAVPVTGEVFHCASGDLTISSGTVDNFVNGVQDARGIQHVTGTIVPHDVTLTDGTNDYSISGAAWFGITAADPESGDITVETDTEFFVIRNADGGVYAKVQYVEHLAPNGHLVTLDAGACETPQD